MVHCTAIHTLATSPLRPPGSSLLRYVGMACIGQGDRIILKDTFAPLASHPCAPIVKHCAQHRLTGACPSQRSA
jgi:hypothetical protein